MKKTFALKKTPYKANLMQLLLGDIADAIGGTLFGSPKSIITGINFIDKAGPNQITFAFGKKIIQRLEQENFCKASAIIVPKYYNGFFSNVIKVDNPELACVKVISLFYPLDTIKYEVSPKADIHHSARLGEQVFVASNASVGARTVIGDRTVIQTGAHVGNDVIIGNDTTLSHGVIISAHTYIGNRVIIQPGSLVGGDGFGYIKDGTSLFKIPHVGHVVVEDDVHIGAYNTIERANLGQTLIRQGVKTGNLVYIAHNVTIGINTQIGGQSGIAGNTIIGDNVIIGPQSGVDQELIIGNNVVIGPKAAIITDLEDGESAYGGPGMSRQGWLRSASMIPQLSKMQLKISKMTRQIDELETKIQHLSKVSED